MTDPYNSIFGFVLFSAVFFHHSNEQMQLPSKLLVDEIRKYNREKLNIIRY